MLIAIWMVPLLALLSDAAIVDVGIQIEFVSLVTESALKK